MTPALPHDAMPRVLRAGDSAAWCVSLADYPAGEWQLVYAATNDVARYEWLAAPDTPGSPVHRVNILAGLSAGWLAGDYTAVPWFERGRGRSTERVTLATWPLRILPNLADADGPVDARGPARRALDDLRAALGTWLATSGQVYSYLIAGRSMSFASSAEIRQRIALAESEARREDAASGLGTYAGAGRTRIMVRF